MELPILSFIFIYLSSSLHFLIRLPTSPHLPALEPKDAIKLCQPKPKFNGTLGAVTTRPNHQTKFDEEQTLNNSIVT